MMKKLIFGFLSLFFFLSSMTCNPDPVPTGPFAGGTGAPGNPYLIATAAQLKQLADFVNASDPEYNNKAYKLTAANLSLSAYGSGAGWTPIGTYDYPFMGAFDGNGNTISDLFINRSTTDDIGLFGVIKGGTVKNLAVVVSSGGVTGNTYTGGIVGSLLDGGTIERCFVTGGKVSGDRSVGGVMGTMEGNNNISNCYTTCAVSGRYCVGGIAGDIYSGYGNITRCFATGEVSGNYGVGGIVGYVRSTTGKVENNVALNSGITRIGAGADTDFGRVTGENKGTLTNNFARYGMVLPSGVTATPDATGIHGASVLSSSYKGGNSDTWWSGASGPTFSTATWSFAASRLPWLVGFNGTQNPTAL